MDSNVYSYAGDMSLTKSDPTREWSDTASVVFYLVFSKLSGLSIDTYTSTVVVGVLSCSPRF